MELPWLTLLTFTPLLAAVVIGLLFRGPRAGRGARGFALAAQVVVLVLTGILVAGFDTANGGMQWVERRAWVPSLGIDYHLGVDGLGIVAVLLSAIIPFFAAVMSERVASGRETLYYSLLLILQCGLFGTFTALNFFHWFLFWEVSLVPAYILVRLFGGLEAGRASFQFFVYTMVGSVALLLAFLALRAAGGSFDFQELAQFGRSGQLATALAEQLPWAGLLASGQTLAWLVFAGVLLGFAVKVPLWPFHTWLPDTYTEAPSPVTMVMTGVLSKMGVYGLLRIAMPIFPQQFAASQPWLLALALATVVLPALAAFAHTDIKRVFAYSSVNHLGYCLLALFAVSPGGIGQEWLDNVGAPALNGVVLQMFNHGLTAATLFALVEALERRTEGIRDYSQLGGLRMVAPVYCGLAGISVFASIGLPGLNGFVSEFLIFRGTFAAAPWSAAIAVVGLLATAIFLLTVMQRAFHGPLDNAWAGFPDLTASERVRFGVPVGLMLILGIYPNLVLRLTNATMLQLASGI